MDPEIMRQHVTRACEVVKPYTVLVVDDEDYILKFMAIMLRTSGYQVLTAGDGVKGLEIIRSGVVDLVITDLAMPQLDGLEFIKQVRGFSKLPVIVLSACGSEKKRLNAFENGANDYFVKPFDPRELVSCVKARLPVNRD